MINYLMVLALFLLLVLLSLPTIMHLSAILKQDRSMSGSAPEPRNGRPLFASVPASARLAPIGVQTGSADHALV